MDEDMREAYRELEDDIREALKKHRGNRSVLSTMLNTLLVCPDHPYGLGTLYGTEFDGELKGKVRFVIAETRDLPEDRLYSKERRLIQEIKTELAQGRRCQVFAVYTQKHDVTARLQQHSQQRRHSLGRAACQCGHFEARILVCQTGQERRSGGHLSSEAGRDRARPARLSYNHLLRVRIFTAHASTGQPKVMANWASMAGRVKFMCQEGTMQTACLRHMGKKLLVALTMEGKFAGEGLQSIDEDDDMLSAMARELVERNGIGETADSVWKALNAEHTKLFPSTAFLIDDVSSAELASSPLPGQNTAAALIEGTTGGDSVVIFGQRPRSLGRRPRGTAVVPEQASLFG
jgi:hypothetical protein